MLKEDFQCEKCLLQVVKSTKVLLARICEKIKTVDKNFIPFSSDSDYGIKVWYFLLLDYGFLVEWKV